MQSPVVAERENYKILRYETNNYNIHGGKKENSFISRIKSYNLTIQLTISLSLEDIFWLDFIFAISLETVSVSIKRNYMVID